MFFLDHLISECRAALAADPSHRLVREAVGRAVGEPLSVLKGLGEPKRAEIQKLYHAGDLTILNVIWGPMMTVMPHDHRMWAVIGIYTGREDNIFWRRLPSGSGRVEAVGEGLVHWRCRDPRPTHHPFADESDPPLDWGDSCLWRRLLRGRTQRVGLRNFVGVPVRRRAT